MVAFGKRRSLVSFSFSSTYSIRYPHIAAMAEEVRVVCASLSKRTLIRVDVQISLLKDYLDMSQLNCLNESDAHTVKGILAGKAKNTGSAYLLSDVDEQLLITISVCPVSFARAPARRRRRAASASSSTKPCA
jgi:hypothetical protein